VTATPIERLLVRGADLLVLGIGWEGLRFAAERGGPGRLEADAAGGTVTLAFPPQAIAEAKYSVDGDVSRRAARLGGPSRLTFRVAPGAAFDLTVEGLLAALGAHPLDTATTSDATAIELPWHLTISPQAASGTDVVSDHEPRPVRSGAGGVGLWRAALRARGADTGDAALDVLPLGADQSDAGIDLQPLSGAQRQGLVDAAHDATGPKLARARRLELSALGGSLSAALTTSASIEWNHEATQGRDHYVRVAEHGVLYPFGHRAVYISSAERRLDPAGSHAVAGLHRKDLLMVIDPVRATTDGDLDLRRRFPFSQVEMLATGHPGVRPPVDAEQIKVRRPVEPHGELGEQLAELQRVAAEAAAAVQERIDALPATFASFVEQQLGSSLELVGAQVTLAAIPDPDALEQENRDLNLSIDRMEEELSRLVPVTGPDGETINPDPEQIRILQEAISEAISMLHSADEIARARIDLAAAITEVNRLQAIVEAEYNGLARTVHDLALQGDEQARGAEALAADAAALDAKIHHLADLEDDDHPIGFVPRGADGCPLRFALRCAGPEGDVAMAVPLVFVKDVTMAEEEFFPEFHSLTDPGAVAAVATAWAEHAAVPVGGVRIDMVASGQDPPSPGDVHEVHTLVLEAVAQGGTFRPAITQFEVALPALRTVLPEQASALQTLHFTDAFREQVQLPELPFAFDPTFSGDPLKGIPASFAEHADRAGGLVSPQFVIDSISRSLGPVAAGALPPALADALPIDVPKFDLKSVYEGATLLGFPLVDLLKLPQNPLSAPAEQLPLPPEIVQLAEGGIPTGMTMTWTLPLKDKGPFKSTAGTKLVLSVECSRDIRQTTCAVNDFTLALPPGGGSLEGLLSLSFTAVRFTQQEGRAPDLELQGMKIGFGGALKLLEELQQELGKVIDLPKNLPKVDVRPAGLTASYGLSAPKVTAGSFLIRNIAMNAGVDVPFDGKPVTVSLAFAKRENPFNVSIMAFGGGGYIDLTLGPTGLLKLEASIEFGASLEVNFFIAKGEVHALGGVRFAAAGDSIDIDGFVRIGGSVEVLGLVSVSIELVVTLSYRSGNRLVGRATLVIEIDLTLYSDTVEIDSGEWVLAGSSDRGRSDRDSSFLRRATADDAGALEAWQSYREAFAP
jgi:hypothetical protein